MREVKRNKREEGSGVLYLILVLVVFSSIFGVVNNNMRFSAKNSELFDRKMTEIYGSRFVNQMVADDQLCSMTSFLDLLQAAKGWSVAGVSKPTKLLDDAPFVDYSKIGENELTWPRGLLKDGETMFASGTSPGDRNATLSGDAVPLGLYYGQSENSKRPVQKTTVAGKTYIRIPIDVWTRGTIGGASAIWNSVPTYIELDPADPNSAVACYRPVSSRSLCLDSGGVFDPTKTPKCKLP